MSHPAPDARRFSLDSLERRRATRPVPIDNAMLPAGAPMIFYCPDCGWPADIKPEDYIGPVRPRCSECEFLREKGWLLDA